MLKDAKKRLVFALDVDSFDKAQALVEQLRDQVGL
ncbi:MAG: orotidine-5'-phosphate decarboxylase, partial [Desulfuromonadales bacterium]|nr:orotidine-5'-phosphate decarboxylase [Desulfuromonadales bacterium]